MDYPLRVDFEDTPGSGPHEKTNPDNSRFDPKRTEEIREEYKHPFWKVAGEMAEKVGGHGGMDFIMDLRWAYCLQNGLPLDQDVYDLASWSTINELSERSVRNRSASVDIPDFTRGGWRNAKPLGIVDVDLKKLDTRRLDELKPAGGGMRV